MIKIARMDARIGRPNFSIGLMSAGTGRTSLHGNLGGRGGEHPVTWTRGLEPRLPASRLPLLEGASRVIGPSIRLTIPHSTGRRQSPTAAPGRCHRSWLGLPRSRWAPAPCVRTHCCAPRCAPVPGPPLGVHPRGPYEPPLHDLDDREIVSVARPETRSRWREAARTRAEAPGLKGSPTPIRTTGSVVRVNGMLGRFERGSPAVRMTNRASVRLRRQGLDEPPGVEERRGGLEHRSRTRRSGRRTGN